MIITTPAAFAAAIKACTGAIVLQGSFPVLVVDHNPCPVAIDATAAKIAGLTMYGSKHVKIRGGTYQGAPFGEITISGGADDISVADGIFVGAVTAGISASNSTHLAFDNNTITGSAGDGIDIANVQHVSVTRTRCFGFSAKNGLHPDCVQGWSVGVDRQTTDVVVSGTWAIGEMQGVTFFDHPILTPHQAPTGGFQRITLKDNNLALVDPQCVALYNATDSVVTGNTCSTLAGARWAAKINVFGGARNVVSGNVAGAAP